MRNLAIAQHRRAWQEYAERGNFPSARARVREFTQPRGRMRAQFSLFRGLQHAQARGL